jgi:hypothetical protein
MFDSTMSSTDVHLERVPLPRKIIPRVFLYFGLSMALSVCIFFSGLDNYFAADDCG